MSLTGSTRTTTTAGIALLAAGLALCTSGAIRDSLPHALGGTCLTTVALTLIALTLIRQWVSDTRHERKDLAAARHDAEAQQRKFFALQAANEGEMARFKRDMNMEKARIVETLRVEREAMRAQFEEERLQVSQNAFRMGVEMERSGALRAVKPVQLDNLIPFPEQASRASEHQRSREHGVVGP
jgi:E3 ubiquitin-protein ligase DOA10